MQELFVEIWSDIACPWCYVGKRRFEAALASLESQLAVAVRWRAFELDPSAPRSADPSVSYAERLAAKYATSLDQAEAMIRGMVETAAAEGLAFDFDRIRPGNTFDAHRLLALGRARGLDAPLKERLLRAYLTEGIAIGEPSLLAQIAAEAGLAEEDVASVLGGNAYADEVRADEAEAARLGIHSVPTFRIAGQRILSGAQPPEILRHALLEGAGALGAPPG